MTHHITPQPNPFQSTHVCTSSFGRFCSNSVQVFHIFFIYKIFHVSNCFYNILQNQSLKKQTLSNKFSKILQNSAQNSLFFLYKIPHKTIQNSLYFFKCIHPSHHITSHHIHSIHSCIHIYVKIKIKNT